MPAATTRRGFLASAAAALAQSPAPRPNILFLMTDEHRFDAVGYANPAVRTPHLDRLARGSVVFTHAYSTSPSCIPARAAIFTGRYPTQCGAPTYITYLPPTETTFMSRLRAAGYHTAVIGKQHFGESKIERGYDEAEITDFHTPPARLTAPGDVPYHRFLWDNGIRRRDQLTRPAGRFVSQWTGDHRFHIDDYLGERARDWIANRRPATKPWFLTVSFPGPHQPFDGLGLPQEKRYRLDGIDLPATTAAALAAKPPHYSDIANRSGGLSPDEIRRIRLAYYSKISLIDDKIGAILAALRDSGQYDNTLIAFTTDHGDYMGDFGMVYKAQYLSEALMRIPLLVKPPIAGFTGRRESAFAQSFDLAPTFLAAAGAAIPAEMSARNLSPFWQSPASAPRREHCFLDGHTLQGVRDRRWKLVHYRDRPYGELYDLESDPSEQRNLWDAPEGREPKAALRARLVDHLLSLGSRADARWNTGAPDI